MSAKRIIRACLRRLGYDIVGFTALSHPQPRLRALLGHLGIDVVLDVGANEGQYAQFLRREIGFRGRIESFEPLPEAFARLEARSRSDGLWNAHQFALGEAPATLPINVAPISTFNSFLTASALLRRECPVGCGERQVQVPVHTLDATLPKLTRPGERIWLKVDTQGYERQVLAGGGEVLPHIAGGQLEVPLQRAYDGAADLRELLALLAAGGFVPVGMEPGFGNPRTGEVYECDLFFARPTGGEARAHPCPATGTPPIRP